MPPTRVHLMDGFAPTGRRVRAACACGYQTTPRASEALALAALMADHSLTSAMCALCGADYSGRHWLLVGRSLMQVLTDPVSGNEFLVCRDLPRSCREGAARRQVHLDRAAADAFGVDLPPPTLRVVKDGA